MKFVTIREAASLLLILLLLAGGGDLSPVEESVSGVEAAMSTEEDAPRVRTIPSSGTSTVDSDTSSDNGTASDSDPVSDSSAASDSGTALGSVTGIGDSVMLGAAEALAQQIPGCVIDGKVSRQVQAGLDTAKALDANGQLGDIVLIGLGINGTFSAETGQALLDYLGPDRSVYWITAYGRTVSWQDEVNDTIRQLAETNPNVQLIDWAAAAPDHPEWFYDDGIHLRPAGRTAYAALVQQALGL